jgi:hypothetical protein
VTVIVVLLVVAAGGVVFALAWSRRGATEKSLEDAIAAFRERARDEGADALRPPPGVYRYRGTGSEKLSVLGTSQPWGPKIPATVTHDRNGCWRFRVDYNSHHSQTWDRCPAGSGLLERGGRTAQTFDFVAASIGDVEVIRCDPPFDALRLGARPGDSWPMACRGHSSSRGTQVETEGTTTYVGPARVRVDGKAEAALHYRTRQRLSGSQVGTERVDTWYSARNALPLKLARDIDVATPSPLGDVTYRERGTAVIRSLVPRR